MNVRFVPNLSIRNVWAEDFSFYRQRLHGTLLSYSTSPHSQPGFPSAELFLVDIPSSILKSIRVCVIVLEYSLTSLSNVLQCSGALEPPNHVT